MYNELVNTGTTYLSNAQMGSLQVDVYLNLPSGSSKPAMLDQSVFLQGPKGYTGYKGYTG